MMMIVEDFREMGGLLLLPVRSWTGLLVSKHLVFLSITQGNISKLSKK